MTEQNSTNKTQLVETSTVSQITPLSPAAMMIEAKRAGLGPDELREMLAVQKEWEANEARKAYHLAVKAFKAEQIVITKDKRVKFGDTDFTHASLANIVGTTIPYLSRHGLSHSWTTEQTDSVVKVTCTLTHELGHSERTSMQSAPDASGKKNAIQAIASAVTYLERYTFMAITGLAAYDMADDDAQGAIEYITENQVLNLEALIDEVGANKANFLKACKVDSLESMPASKYRTAVQMLEKKRAQE